MSAGDFAMGMLVGSVFASAVWWVTLAWLVLSPLERIAHKWRRPSVGAAALQPEPVFTEHQWAEARHATGDIYSDELGELRADLSRAIAAVDLLARRHDAEATR